MEQISSLIRGDIERGTVDCLVRKARGLSLTQAKALQLFKRSLISLLLGVHSLNACTFQVVVVQYFVPVLNVKDAWNLVCKLGVLFALREADHLSAISWHVREV